MTALIITIHIIVCIALILIVLLQTGKGASMGAVFGGAGSQTLFGNTGASSFLSKMTTWAAIVFMITSLTLAYISKSGGKSVVSDIQPPTQQTQVPVTETIPVATPQTPTAPLSVSEPEPISTEIPAQPQTEQPAALTPVEDKKVEPVEQQVDAKTTAPAIEEPVPEPSSQKPAAP
ncbi:MAG: preprotein translocase subunit SecG [Desulfobacteraceae bacterium]|nr:MAG: preprotein translocase subunit SecG [Desulfobacteraceae bacterium]